MNATSKATYILNFSREIKQGALYKSNPDIAFANNGQDAGGNSRNRAEKPSAVVNISQESKALSKTSSIPTGPADNSSSTGFSAFIHDFNQQILENGKKAQVLQQTPGGDSAQRNAVAGKAANYLLSEYYGIKGPNADNSSSDNPFAQLSRKDLSNVAFDKSNKFTPAERVLAFMQISEKDAKFQNKYFDLASNTSQAGSAEGKNYLAREMDARLASGMSDAEKQWRGWDNSDIKPPEHAPAGPRPNYDGGLGGSRDSVFAVAKNDSASAQLISVPAGEITQNKSNNVWLEKVVHMLDTSAAAG